MNFRDRKIFNINSHQNHRSIEFRRPSVMLPINAQHLFFINYHHFYQVKRCHSLEEISSKHTPYQQHNTSIHRTHCFFFHTFYLVSLHLPSFHFIFFASRIICGNLPFFHPYLWFKDAQSSGIDGYREKDHHQPKNGQSQSSNQQQHWRRPIHFSITNHESGLQWCIYCITVPANGPAIESVPSSTDPVQPSSTNFIITINNFEIYCQDISIILIITNRNQCKSKSFWQ